MAYWTGGLNGVDVAPTLQGSNITTLIEYEFIIVKITGATYGGSFERQRGFNECFSAIPDGKRRGIYHFAGGGNVTDEANYFISALDGVDLTNTVLILDWESMDDTGASGANKTFGTSGANSWISSFLSIVKEKTGKDAIVYMSASAQSQLPEEVTTTRRWIAQYANDDTINGYPDSVWTDGTYSQPLAYQYTSHLILSGYSGRLDGDKLYDAEQWDKLAGGSVTPPTPTPPTIKKVKIKYIWQFPTFQKNHYKW